MQINILRFDTLASTSTEAAAQARRGAPEGLCIVAGHQTAGRGRLGRNWLSPAGSGLYLSIVLRPRTEMRFLPLITLLSAVAVFDTLTELFRIQPDIKWVNDVLVNKKKISGILAETVETSKGLAVIVGIGLNLTSENFPPELEKIATSVETETGETPNTELTLRHLIGNFRENYDLFPVPNGFETIRRKWLERSSYGSGKEVRVRLTGETFVGKTCGIEENGALRIKTADGGLRIIQAGDVEMLRPAD